MKIKKALILFLTAIMALNFIPAAGAEGVSVHFGGIGIDRYGTVVVAAEYNETLYVLGEMTGTTCAAVPVTSFNPDGSYDLSPDDVTFFTKEDEPETVEIAYSGFRAYYTPFYLRSESGYLSFDNNGMLAYSQQKEERKWWVDGKTYRNQDGRFDHIDVIVNEINSDANNKKIVLKVDNGDPYFTIAEQVDENNIGTSVKYSICDHCDMVHYEEIEPTCCENGRKEYYYCPYCDIRFADRYGAEPIFGSLTNYAYSAIDEDGDGVCDDCGKNMPVYMKTTDPDDIISGGKYLIVTEIDGNVYALKNIDSDWMDEQYQMGNYDIDALPAVEQISDNDSVTFTDAKNSDAMMTTFRFAADGLDWSLGVRYGIHYALDGTNYTLICEEGGLRVYPDDEAKYGFRPTMNGNGSVNILSMFDLWWNYNEAPGNEIRLRAFKSVENGEETVFFGAKPLANFVHEGATVTEYPIYLYRLFECGEINDISYKISDFPSNPDYTAVTDSGALVSENSVYASNISGVSEALTQEAIDDFVPTVSGAEESVALGVTTDVTVLDYSADDGAMTFSIDPYLYNPATDDRLPIPDDVFRGSEMTVTLYVCDIYPEQIIHEKADGTLEYFYDKYSSEVENGTAEPFTVEFDNDGSTYVTFKVTDFSNIRVLRNAERPQNTDAYITGYDEYTKTVLIDSTSGGNYLLILADYNGEVLNDTAYLRVNCSSGLNEIPVDEYGINIGTDDKLFLWTGLFSEPCCEPYTVYEKKL